MAIVLASLLSRLGYQMARSPVLPTFAADLGASPELIGVVVAASTVTGISSSCHPARSQTCSGASA